MHPSGQCVSFIHHKKTVPVQLTAAKNNENGNKSKSKCKTTPAKATFHSEYSQYEPAGLDSRRTRPKIFPASLDAMSAIADAAPVDVMKGACNVTARNNTGVKSLV